MKLNKKLALLGGAGITLLIALLLIVLLYMAPFIMYFFFWVTSIPDQIRNEKIKEEQFKIANEMVGLQVDGLDIKVDTMTVNLYGMQEIYNSDYMNMEYNYIGQNRYYRGYSEMILQLRNINDTGDDYYKDEEVVAVFEYIINMLNEYDLDYQYCEAYDEYYIGFDDDTILEYTEDNGKLHTYNCAFEGGISIALCCNSGEGEQVVLRLLFGLDEDNVEYKIGENIKTKLIEYADTLDEFWRRDTDNTIRFINHDAVTPFETFH
ncbi:MAG: hypothetical protein R3Y54_00295 [Eubacteriales bacterium]